MNTLYYGDNLSVLRGCIDDESVDLIYLDPPFNSQAKIGVFITLADSTGPMRTEAVKTGFYETMYGKYPKIQILTIRELFEGKQPNIPLVDASAFKKAANEIEGGDQDKLPFEPGTRI